MITATFTLAGLALLMLQILVVDTHRWVRDVEASTRDFDHDTKIFPDYTP